MKRKNVSKRTVAIGILLWFIFLWLHTFVRMVSYEESKGVVGYVVLAIITVAVSIFYYWCIVGSFDFIEENLEVDIRCNMKILGSIYLLLLLGFISEIVIPGFSIFEYKDIWTGNLKVSKEYLFDIYAVVIFPLFSEITFKAMRKEKFQRKSILMGSLQLIGMTIAGYAVFAALSNIWLIELAVINILTVAIGIYKYTWNYSFVDKKKMFLLDVIYILGWFMILALRGGYEGSFQEYMYAGDWNAYVDHVRTLVRNADFVGISSLIAEINAISEFLYQRNNFIHQLLYYGGWYSVGAVVLAMVAFLLILIKMLDVKKYYMKKHFLIYAAALWIFCIRIIMGMFYTFALIPYPVSLPFSGTKGIYTDTIVFSLLLICAYENYRIDRIKNCEMTGIKEFFDDSEILDVKKIKTEESFEKDFFEERVNVIGNEKSLSCKAMWLCAEEVGYVAFETLTEKGFILEYSDEEWKVPENKSLIQELFKEYTDIRLSGYVEELDHEEDW